MAKNFRPQSSVSIDFKQILNGCSAHDLCKHLQLPVAPEGLALQAEAARAREEEEARKQWEEDESALRSLRMALREITTKLLCTRQWKDFWEPVDPEEDPEYYSQVPSTDILVHSDARILFHGVWMRNLLFSNGRISGSIQESCSSAWMEFGGKTSGHQ